MGFIKQIRVYVSDVVFYSADCNYLLPVVPDKNNRRKLYYDEQKSFEKVSVLDKRKIGFNPTFFRRERKTLAHTAMLSLRFTISYKIH